MDSLGIILGGLGLALMAGLSGVGSSIGLVTAGNAAVGALKKRPEIFGPALVLSALPASQGLYGFVAYIIYQPFLTSNITVFNGGVMLAAGIAFGIVALASAIKMGQLLASGINALGSGSDVFAPTLILAAFPELYAILGLVVAILLKGLMV
jgi:V/A-type H+-transporting ATPase subunit K